MNNKKIEFQEIRDFGQVFNTGFLFMRQHFFRIFRYLLTIGGPFLLVGVGVSALLMVRLQGFSALATSESNSIFSWADFGISYIVNIASFFVGFVMITAVINAYIKLYIESNSANPDIQLGDVWNRVRKDFFRLVGQFLLVGVLGIIIFGAFFGITVVLFSGSSSSTASQVALVILSIFVFTGAFCYLMPYFGGIFFTQMYFEDNNFIKGIIRTFYLVNGNWGLTFGLGVVNTIIMYVFFLVCYIPFSLILFTTSMFQPGGIPDISSTTGLVIGMTVFMTLAYMITFILHYVMAAVHYYNLRERKEGGSLLAKIQTIGTVENTSKTVVDFYDEEEKY